MSRFNSLAAGRVRIRCRPPPQREPQLELVKAAQVRAADLDVVVMPGPHHLGPIELNRIMDIADVETVLPRLSFARWSLIRHGQ